MRWGRATYLIPGGTFPGSSRLTPIPSSRSRLGSPVNRLTGCGPVLCNLVGKMMKTVMSTQRVVKVSSNIPSFENYSLGRLAWLLALKQLGPQTKEYFTQVNEEKSSPGPLPATLTMAS